MRLAALYRTDAGDTRLHVAVDGGFAAVDELAAGARRPDLAGLRDVGDLYARGADALEHLRELAATATASVAPDGARYAPPVLRPGKIISSARLRRPCRREPTAKPDRIVLFAKFRPAWSGTDPIRYPAIAAELDYEGELAVVIGRQARQVPADRRSTTSTATRSSTMSPPATSRAPTAADPRQGPRHVARSARSCSTPPRPQSPRLAAHPGERGGAPGRHCAQMITGVPEPVAYISNGITLDRATSSPPARRSA